jgi:hypothetical protein
MPTLNWAAYPPGLILDSHWIQLYPTDGTLVDFAGRCGKIGFVLRSFTNPMIDSPPTADTLPSKSKSNWKAIGILSFLLLVLSVLGGIFGVYDRAFPSRPRIVGSVDVSHFRLPYSTVASVKEKYEFGEVKPPGFDQIDGTSCSYISITVANSGSLPAEECTLKIDGLSDSYFAVVQYDNGKTEESVFKREFPLGKMPISSTVYLSIWTASDIIRKISVVHSTKEVILWNNDPLVVVWWLFKLIIGLAILLICVIVGTGCVAVRWVTVASAHTTVDPRRTCSSNSSI